MVHPLFLVPIQCSHNNLPQGQYNLNVFSRLYSAPSGSNNSPFFQETQPVFKEGPGFVRLSSELASGWREGKLSFYLAWIPKPKWGGTTFSVLSLRQPAYLIREPTPSRWGHTEFFWSYSPDRLPTFFQKKFFFLLVLFGRAGCDFANTYGHFYLFSWTLSQVAKLESWCFKPIPEWDNGDWCWCLSTWRQTLDTVRQALSRRAGCSCKEFTTMEGWGECEMTWLNLAAAIAVLPHRCSR